MGLIPEATIQDIRDRADIVSTINRYVELKPAGRNWKGLCPFHQEKTPSFNVNMDRQIFHCFGCGEGGNVITFLVKHENLTFPEAVRTLASELGIEVPETDRRDRGETEKLFVALEEASRCFQEQLSLPSGKLAMDYLEARGLDAQTIAQFELGFAPDRWDTLVSAFEKARIPLEAGESTGLLSARSSGGHYDRLRGRVIFPIRDVRGRVIGFGGRALLADQEPKYLNTNESPVYQKRRVFYGYPNALEPIRRAGRVIVCEGYFDAIALARAGLGEAVATCGTALTPDHAQDLKRRTKRVSLLFDGDEAGQKAMERALEVLLPAGLRVSAVILPDGRDPDDYLAEKGAESLRTVVDRARDAVDVVIQRVMRSAGSTPGDKADAVRHVARLVAAISDPVERSEYTRRLAMATSTDPGAVESVVREERRGQASGRESESVPGKLQSRRTSPEDRHLRLLGSILSQHPEFATPDHLYDINHVLPDGPWKALIIEIIDAGSSGIVDERGALDFDRMEDRLTSEQMGMLREVMVEESVLSTDTSPETVFIQLLDRYRIKDLEMREQELKRRLAEPDSDHVKLLAERQELIERRKALNRETNHPPP